MSRKCAWCRRCMGETPPFDDHTVTHGICLVCQQRYLEEAASCGEANPPDAAPLDLKCSTLERQDYVI